MTRPSLLLLAVFAAHVLLWTVEAHQVLVDVKVSETVTETFELRGCDARDLEVGDQVTIAPATAHGTNACLRRIRVRPEWGVEHPLGTVIAVRIIGK